MAHVGLIAAVLVPVAPSVKAGAAALEAGCHAVTIISRAPSRGSRRTYATEQARQSSSFFVREARAHRRFDGFGVDRPHLIAKCATVAGHRDQVTTAVVGAGGFVDCPGGHHTVEKT